MSITTTIDTDGEVLGIHHDTVQGLLDFVNAFTLSLSSNPLAGTELDITCRITISNKGADGGLDTSSPSVLS